MDFGGYLESADDAAFEEYVRDFPYEEEVSESSGAKLEYVKDGVMYRGEKFPGVNKPKRYTGKGKFKKRVLARDGDEVKVLNYGHSDYDDYTKHKDPERRASFRKRHKCDPVGKLKKTTKRYWACQDLW